MLYVQRWNWKSHDQIHHPSEYFRNSFGVLGVLCPCSGFVVVDAKKEETLMRDQRQENELVVTFSIPSSSLGPMIVNLLMANAKIEAIGLVTEQENVPEIAPPDKAKAKVSSKAKKAVLNLLVNGAKKEVLLAEYKAYGGNGRGFNPWFKTVALQRGGKFFLKSRTK